MPLCSNCHSHKSYLECLTPFQDNPLASVFDPTVYAAFHDSPKPRQAVQQLRLPSNANALEIDTVRCRRAALEYNQQPLPIFSPIDAIQELENCTLGDYNFVDKDVDILDVCKYAKHFPYSGRRWYWKAACQYMLDEKNITYNDIKYTLTATAHISHDFLQTCFKRCKTR